MMWGLWERKDKGILVFTAAKKNRQGWWCSIVGGAKERVCTKVNILKSNPVP